MKVEKFRIFADVLGIDGTLEQYFYARGKVEGDYSFTKKGQEADRVEYTPIKAELGKKIAARIRLMFPEFEEWSWGAGRENGIYYITLYNPEWK